MRMTAEQAATMMLAKLPRTRSPTARAVPARPMSDSTRIPTVKPATARARLTATIVAQIKGAAPAR